MIQNQLKEDKQQEKLPVRFSNEITNLIEDIDFYNRNNIDALLQWRDYLESMVSYISDPVMAWDNMNRFRHFPNGATQINEVGHDVTFMVKTNKNTNQTYVFIIDLDIKAEGFGLNIPSLFEENKQLYCESVRKVLSLISRIENL